MRLRLLLPVVVILTVAGMLSSFLQNSPRLVLDRIEPQAVAPVDQPAAGRGIFGAQGQVEFLKSVVKLAAVCVLGFLLLRARPARRPERHVHGAQRAARAGPGDRQRGS